MTELIADYNKKDTHTLEDIAKFHARYERVHPFQDGNGQTGRMIIFKECLKNNLVPLIIMDDNKKLYYKALNKASVDLDFTVLSEFLLSEQLNYYNLSENFVIPVIPKAKDKHKDLER